ncbi:hypothetical protein GCM10010266_44400 [Streptomyces griseomycini]|nr:hypothetical protein GCM10010266_44400 [Streptomyces griseomycini]
MSIRYGERLIEADATASVGSVADSDDNAMAEALNGSFRAEPIEHRGPWRDADQVERAVVRWVGWYNTERLHSALDYLPPEEFEARHHRSRAPDRPAPSGPGTATSHFVRNSVERASRHFPNPSLTELSRAFRTHAPAANPQVSHVAATYSRLHAVNFGKQVEHHRPHLENTRKTQVRAPLQRAPK